MTRASQFLPRSVAGVTFAQSLALVPPSVVVALADPERYVLHLTTALIAALVWEAIFAFLRHHSPSVHGLTTALIVAVLAPPEIAVWQVAFVVSLGAVLGELIFGGRGFGFIHPATVASALLLISFPQVQLPPQTEVLALATLPGGALLLAVGLISWRVVVAAVMTTAIGLGMAGSILDAAALATTLAFGLIFLICDPIPAASTNFGRWVYGALAGGLIVVFSSGGPPTVEVVIFAALMANIFAPLIDHLAALSHARRRARQHA